MQPPQTQTDLQTRLDQVRTYAHEIIASALNKPNFHQQFWPSWSFNATPAALGVASPQQYRNMAETHRDIADHHVVRAQQCFEPHYQGSPQRIRVAALVGKVRGHRAVIETVLQMAKDGTLPKQHEIANVSTQKLLSQIAPWGVSYAANLRTVDAQHVGRLGASRSEARAYDPSFDQGMLDACREVDVVFEAMASSQMSAKGRNALLYEIKLRHQDEWALADEADAAIVLARNEEELADEALKAAGIADYAWKAAFEEYEMWDDVRALRDGNEFEVAVQQCNALDLETAPVTAGRELSML